MVDKRVFWVVFIVFQLIRMSKSLKSFFKESLNEEQPPGTIILTLASATEINQMSGDAGRVVVTKMEQQNRVEFSLLDSLDSRFFACGKYSSIITTQTRLDRESLCADVSVKHCCDPKSSNPELCALQFQVAVKTISEIQLVQVVIELIDINDNTPTFQRNQQMLFINENSRIGEIHIFKVKDADSHSNSIKQINLNCLNPITKEYFSIRKGNDDQVRLILKKNLDRESIDSFNFIITASDGGKISRTGSISVTVNVTDVNDNFPKWITENFDVTVKENVEINSLILKLEATDKDVNNNGKVTYEYDYTKNDEEIRWRNIFIINALNGEVRLQHKLDYESLIKPEIRLHVIARDNGEEISHSITGVILIRVTDVNDNHPIITPTSLSPDKMFKVKENVANVQQVASISVSDADTKQGGEVTCEVDHQMFRLVPLSNMLTKGYSLIARGIVDREKTQFITITIKCEDHGIPNLSSTKIIRVTVLDDNDHSPKFFTSLFQFEIMENNAPGQFIGRINATDRDVDHNGQITYEVDTDVSSIVTLHPYSGILSANREFDRERVDSYTFTVYAKDSGETARSTSATVQLRITDDNDHSPVFIGTNFFNIPENKHPGSLVGQVQAKDNDSGRNAKIRYRLETKLMHFAIDAQTGRILLRSGNLDREEVGSYDLRVVAEDGGQPMRSAEYTIHVIIEDVNDNAPIFIFPTPRDNKVNVSCGQGPNRVIALIRANDSDHGRNSELTYLLLPPHGSIVAAAGTAAQTAAGKNNPSNTRIKSSVSDPTSIFDIDARSGQLFLLDHLPSCNTEDSNSSGRPRLKRPYSLKLPIRVLDHGEPPLSATTYLVINVLPNSADPHSRNGGSNGGYQQRNSPPHLSNPSYWNPDKRSHWTAIISLIVATAVLISLLFIILCLLRRRYNHAASSTYRKGRSKPDFSHVVERPGINNQDLGKVTSDEEDIVMPNSPAEYRTLGTYVGFPTNYYTIGMLGSGSGQKLNNCSVTGTNSDDTISSPGISFGHQKNVNSSNYYQTLAAHNTASYSPLSAAVSHTQPSRQHGNRSLISGNTNTNNNNNNITSNNNSTSPSDKRLLSGRLILSSTLAIPTSSPSPLPQCTSSSTSTSSAAAAAAIASSTTPTNKSSHHSNNIITLHNPISEAIPMTDESTDPVNATMMSDNNSNNNCGEGAGTFANPMVSTYCSVSFV